MRTKVLPVVVVLVAAVPAIAGGLVLRAEAAGTGGPGIVHTGYGDVQVEHAEAVRGLDPHDLGGAAHGIAGLVKRDQVLVQVTVLVRGNGSGKPVEAGSFRLRAGGEPVAPATSSLAKGKLPAGANVEGTLGFVAAINAGRAVLSVPDGTSAVDVVIHPKTVDGSPTGGDSGVTIDPNGGVTLNPGGGSDSDHHHDSGPSAGAADQNTDNNGGESDDQATTGGTEQQRPGATAGRAEGTNAPRTGGIDDQVTYR